MPRRRYAVYILTNRRHTVFYVGVTGDLTRRLDQHRKGSGARFTCRYHVDQLVYVEFFDDVRSAIAREKQLKAGSRRRKESLIEGMNPEWRNLAPK